MNRVYIALKEIAEGRFNRPAVRFGTAAIKGKAEGSEASASQAAILYAVATISKRKGGDHLPPPAMRTMKRLLNRLISVHSIIAYERGQASTRDAITYKLPSYNDVLQARRADPAIATTEHGKGMQWSNGRPSSRRPLTPIQASEWKLYELPAAAATSTSEAPLSAASEPRPNREPSAGAARATTAAGRVTAEQVAALSTLCGRDVDAKIANRILEAAEAAAASEGKVFPPEGLVDLNPKGTHGLCNRVFERKRKMHEQQMYDPSTGRYFIEKRFEWTADNPPGYILRAVADVDLVGPFVNDWNAAPKRDALKRHREDYERAHKCLEELRQRPDDTGLQQKRDDLQRANPDAFAEAWAKFTAKHPEPEPAGERREVGARPRRPRTFADALDPQFAEDERPPPKVSA